MKDKVISRKNSSKNSMKNKSSKSNSFYGLSPNQERIMAILEYKNTETISRKELISLIKKHLNIKDIQDLIEKLQKKKRLVPIKKGLYMVVPFSSIDKKWSLDEYKIIDYLIKGDYYIGLNNAFNFHGFTDQISNKTFVFNTKYSSDRKILQYKFKFIKIKKDKLFGIINKKYPYSDKERTIIDALDYPKYLGGLNKIINTIKSSKYNKNKLVNYSIKYNSTKIMKLVGYLTNSSKLFNTLKNKNSFSYYTTIKNSGTKLLDKKWMIRLT